MDLRRLGVALLVLAGGIALLVFYASRGNRTSREAASQAASAPAGAPSSATAPAQATSAPVAGPVKTEPPPAPSAVKAPEQTEGADRWFGTVANRQECTIGSLSDPNTFLLQLQLTSEGAAVYTAKLTEYFVTVADKRLHEEDPQGYQAACAADPDKYKGHYSLLNPVGPSDAQTLSFATRKLTVQIVGSQEPALTLDGIYDKNWELQDRTDRSATFAYYVYRGRDWDHAKANPVLKLTKTYTLRDGDYTVYVSLGVENLSALPLRVSLDQAGPTGLPEEGVRGEKRQAVYAQYVKEDKKLRVAFKVPGDLAQMRPGSEVTLGSSDGKVLPIAWTGVTNKYFASIAYLLPARSDELLAADWSVGFYARAVKESGDSKTFVTGVRLPPMDLAPGQSARQIGMEVFVGPKKRELFSDPGAPHFRELYRKLDFIATIEFGACCTWGPLALGMMWLLQVFSKATFGNYGVAIILLVFLVRLVLHPLTKKGQVAMMKTQKLAPQVQKLKEKHGDDKETLNKEMMQLYRKQGMTPLLGCLPMVLQMPIWFALFAALSASVELRHAGFLPIWITDLSAPDVVWSWPVKYNLPVVGHMLSLLPILLAIAMFFQTKMTPTMTGVAATEEQRMQQKMMQYMMPVMMLLALYSSPSGLTLYIMASTFAGVLEQKVIRDHIKAREAAAAAVETTVPLPGGSFRGQRPKKGKGPFWVKRG